VQSNHKLCSIAVIFLILSVLIISSFSNSNGIKYQTAKSRGINVESFGNIINNQSKNNTPAMDPNKLIEENSSQTFTLTITINGKGATTPTAGNLTYLPGTIVTLTAHPNGNWTFDNWSGTSNNPAITTTVTMDSNKSVIAFFSAPSKVNGLNFSPYTLPGQNPNQKTMISQEQITRLLMTIKPYTNWIRTYASDNNSELTGRIAHELNIKVAAEAWIGPDDNANKEQLNALIGVAQAGQADLLIVGSEALFRGDVNASQLVNYIISLKNIVPFLPVTTDDAYQELLSNPSVMDVCDIIMANFYPFCAGVNINNAVDDLNLDYLELVSAARGKPVLIGETGWPSDGSATKDAVPSLENAVIYFKNFVSWAKANNVNYFYFEAFSEPWKIIEGTVGSNWGVWDSNGTLKTGMMSVFEI
jgi:glucan 1,3-beta-glucosidase